VQFTLDGREWLEMVGGNGDLVQMDNSWNCFWTRLRK